MRRRRGRRASSAPRPARCEPLLHPHRGGLVGARARRHRRSARRCWRSIRAGGYTGDVVVVHPRRRRVAGVPAYPSLLDVPDGLDLAIVAVPAARVARGLPGRRRGRGARGRRDQLRVPGAGRRRRAAPARAAARWRAPTSIRVVGPNCLGRDGQPARHPAQRDLHPDAAARPAGSPSPRQSGGVGIVLMDLARRARARRRPASSRWATRPTCPATTCSPPGPTTRGHRRRALPRVVRQRRPKFARVARRFAERKPLLAVVGGRSAGGRRAGASHTAAAATPGVGVDALFAQAGVIGCHDAEDLAETALLLDRQPLPDGPRLGDRSATPAAWACWPPTPRPSAAWSSPSCSPALRDAIGRHVLGTTGTTNPVDAGAGATADDARCDRRRAAGLRTRWTRCWSCWSRTGVTDGGPLLDALAGSRRAERHKPFRCSCPWAACPRPRDAPGHHALPLGRVGRPRARARRAVRRVARVPRAVPPTPDDERARSARRRADDAPGDPRAAAGWSRTRRRSCSGCTGSPTAGRLAHDPLAGARGRRPGARVPGRGQGRRPDRRPQVRAGPGAGGLRSAAEVLGPPSGTSSPSSATATCRCSCSRWSPASRWRWAWSATRASARWSWSRPAAPRPTCGTTARSCCRPVGADDAVRALRSLRIWPLLDGFRGSPPADVGGAAASWSSRWAGSPPTCPRWRSSTSTRCWSARPGATCVDVKVLLAEGVPVDAGIPRQLRRRP